ncbi:MAG: hypothetical protein P4M09_07185 [Devosia sp.]|nr:hypothetical protein [Devosia sp.]
MGVLKWLGLGILLVCATPVYADMGWSSYLNARYGYETAVPPGFTGLGEPDAHDGQVFRSGDGRSKLTVWGGYLVHATFDEELRQRLDDLKRGGWTITYQATTPSWGSYSGTRGQRIIYLREISGCKAEQYAIFQLDYPAVQITTMKPLIDRLVAGLRQRLCPGG